MCKYRYQSFPFNTSNCHIASLSNFFYCFFLPQENDLKIYYLLGSAWIDGFPVTSHEPEQRVCYETQVQGAVVILQTFMSLCKERTIVSWSV